MRRLPIWMLATALVLATTAPLRAGESDDKRMCKQGCEEELSNCKSGCQNERDSGDQQETGRYKGCDGGCHSEYASCKDDCESGEGE
ncbi:MAG TPA: hypothetical protein VGR62_11550 [Candidatus Binatia bacterium]|nr:hypothetical protein [Candidatus Binatia bacterium]